MLKLYKRVEDEIHYWETWDDTDNSTIIHWGIVGERGEDTTIKSTESSNFRDEIQKMINQHVEDGYQPVDIEDHYTLLIEYKVDDMGTDQDLEKRTRLQERMDETLGWTGLGHCDGGSMGMGTMEVCCYVIDFETAKKIIEEDLKDTEFADYTRVFDENADS